MLCFCIKQLHQTWHGRGIGHVRLMLSAIGADMKCLSSFRAPELLQYAQTSAVLRRGQSKPHRPSRPHLPQGLMLPRPTQLITPPSSGTFLIPRVPSAVTRRASISPAAPYRTPAQSTGTRKMRMGRRRMGMGKRLGPWPSCERANGKGASSTLLTSPAW